MCYDKTMRSAARSSTGRHLLGVSLLGAASGMRATVGLAAVVVGRGRSGLWSPFDHSLAKPAAVVAVGAEMVVDKLPSTGSRLEPAGMAGRLLFAALAAGLVCQRQRRPKLPAVLLATAAAAVTAKVAHDLRERAAQARPDRDIAVVEDMAALATAAVGSRICAPSW